MCVLLSCVWLFATPWAVASQAPLSMGFSRQEYWGGLSCPPTGDIPDPGIEPASLASPALAGRFFTTSATWESVNPEPIPWSKQSTIIHSPISKPWEANALSF